MTDRPAQNSLIALFHHKWAVPTLAALHASGGGAKFVTLCSRLGVARGSMKRTLSTLCEMGLVMRNPGYGHPMRPEYILTKRGQQLAPACAKLWKTIEKLDVEAMAQKKWTLPALDVLGEKGERFGEVAAALGTVTPRALAQALNDLLEAGFIKRHLKDGAPPYAEYRVTKRGQKLAGRMALLRKAA